MGTATRARDAALALALGGVVLAFAPVPSAPGAFVAGGVGALVLEWALSRRASAVRRVWSRGWVRATAFLGTLLSAGLAAVVLGRVVYAVVLGGCIGYLLVLVGVELRARRQGL
jgi:hypothetical protein